MDHGRILRDGSLAELLAEAPQAPRRRGSSLESLFLDLTTRDLRD
jgi:ABC-2 type transport system ATP-binding protein